MHFEEGLVVIKVDFFLTLKNYPALLFLWLIWWQEIVSLEILDSMASKQIYQSNFNFSHTGKWWQMSKSYRYLSWFFDKITTTAMCWLTPIPGQDQD